MNNKALILGLVILLALGVVIALAISNGPDSQETASDTSQQEAQQNEQVPQSSTAEIKFNNPKKSAHYETNTPAHGSTLAAPPINIVIDFNFDLAAPSSISIKDSQGKEYGVGETIIDTNKLSMRRAFASDAPDGKYTVSYRACWPDKTCHDGSFEFAIDRAQAAEYENLQGKREVTIRMSEIMFAPRNITISKGTKVTWINDESIEHYVNTDSHPAHTYYSAQNSRSLAKGATYSTTFSQPGAYPYHCSAHADTMTGNIIVI